jgi:hypothetical protein
VCGGTGKNRRKLDHKIGMTACRRTGSVREALRHFTGFGLKAGIIPSKRHFGTYILITDCRFAALYVIAAHNGNDIISAVFSAQLMKEQSVTVMKGIQFTDNCGGLQACPPGINTLISLIG